MHEWQLQEAKAHFSEVIKKAVEQGVQNITRHGKRVAVVISEKEYQKLKKPKPSFIKFMRKSPLVGVNIDLSRSQDFGREVDL